MELKIQRRQRDHWRSPRNVVLNTYQCHRKLWSPEASYHLTRVFHDEDYFCRLISLLWLASNQIPLDGKWDARKRLTS